VHAASVGVVDQVVQRIPERLPLRPPGVEQHEVGPLARLDGADLVAQPERRRAEPRAHLQRGLGRDEPDVLARVLVLDGRHVHRAHRVEVIRVVRRIAAERHAHAPRQKLRHAPKRGGATGAFRGGDRAHRDGGAGARDARDLRLVDAERVGEQHVGAEHAQLFEVLGRTLLAAIPVLPARLWPAAVVQREARAPLVGEALERLQQLGAAGLRRERHGPGA